MNRVNSDILNEIISYLKLSEIKKLGICSGYNYEICKKWFHIRTVSMAIANITLE